MKEKNHSLLHATQRGLYARRGAQRSRTLGFRSPITGCPPVCRFICRKQTLHEIYLTRGIQPVVFMISVLAAIEWEIEAEPSGLPPPAAEGGGRRPSS